MAKQKQKDSDWVKQTDFLTGMLKVMLKRWDSGKGSRLGKHLVKRIQKVIGKG